MCSSRLNFRVRLWRRERTRSQRRSYQRRTDHRGRRCRSPCRDQPVRSGASSFAFADVAVINSGTIAAGGDVSLSGAISISSFVADTIELSASALVTNSGSITAGGNVSLIAEVSLSDFAATDLSVIPEVEVLNSGTISAGGDIDFIAATVDVSGFSASSSFGFLERQCHDGNGHRGRRWIFRLRWQHHEFRRDQRRRYCNALTPAPTSTTAVDRSWRRRHSHSWRRHPRFQRHACRFHRWGGRRAERGRFHHGGHGHRARRYRNSCAWTDHHGQSHQRRARLGASVRWMSQERRISFCPASTSAVTTSMWTAARLQRTSSGRLARVPIFVSAPRLLQAGKIWGFRGGRQRHPREPVSSDRCRNRCRRHDYHRRHHRARRHRAEGRGHARRRHLDERSRDDGTGPVDTAGAADALLGGISPATTCYVQGGDVSLDQASRTAQIATLPYAPRPAI